MLAIRGGPKIRRAPLPAWPPRPDETMRAALVEAATGGAERTRALPRKAAFEEAFAAFCGVRHAIGVSSGTTALDLALEALSLPSDGVILAAAFGHPSSVRWAAERHRLHFVDIDAHTLCLSPEALAAALSERRVDAVVTTHVAGRIGYAEEVARLCRAAGIPLIEDAAHAHGAALEDGTRAGRLGAIACFSLHDTKTLPAGEGGVVVTDDDDIAGRIRLRHDIGRSREAGPYDFTALGGNARLSEAAATLAAARLAGLDADNERRHAAAERLRRMLPADAALALLPADPRQSLHPHHVLACRYVDPSGCGPSRRRFALALAAEGIACTVGWPAPLATLPPFAAASADPLPATRRAVEEAIWIDHRLLLDVDGPDQIVEAVEKIARHGDALVPRGTRPGAAS